MSGQWECGWLYPLIARLCAQHCMGTGQEQAVTGEEDKKNSSLEPGMELC